MSGPESMVIRPSGPVRGAVRVPGDKSISHRLAMVCALARGESRIRGFLASEDCLNTLGAMSRLGSETQRSGTAVTVSGCEGRLDVPADALDLGNSGTGMRLLTGLLAGQPFSTTLTGDASLCSRPMGRIKEPLERMGARVSLTGVRGCAPVTVSGGGLRGIEYVLPVASAQVKSCILLAGLFAEGQTTIMEPKPTRDHTELLLRRMGVAIEVKGDAVSLAGPCDLGKVDGMDWSVPGDFSSGAFWLGAAAPVEGAEVVLEGVGLNPRRSALMDVLGRMGADIEVVVTSGSDAWEREGSIRVRGARLRGTEVGGAEIPNLIDELPVVAVMGALAEGTTVIRDAAELRVKESDRIAAVAAGLRAMGVEVEERPDGMVVHGAACLRGGVEVDSLGDHRIAMAMSVAALSAGEAVRILNTACVATSYPDFWRDLERLAGRGDGEG